MPCNLAITITKAAVSNEELLKLLTSEVVHEAVKNFLSRHETYKDRFLGDWQSEPTVWFYIGNCTITITGGQVTVNGPEWAKEEVEVLSAEVNTLLSRLADYLFAQQVQQVLADLSPVEAQAVTVDDQGATRQATVLTLNI